MADNLRFLVHVLQLFFKDRKYGDFRSINRSTAAGLCNSMELSESNTKVNYLYKTLADCT